MTRPIAFSGHDEPDMRGPHAGHHPFPPASTDPWSEKEREAPQEAMDYDSIGLGSVLEHCHRLVSALQVAAREIRRVGQERGRLALENEALRNDNLAQSQRVEELEAEVTELKALVEKLANMGVQERVTPIIPREAPVRILEQVHRGEREEKAKKERQLVLDCLRASPREYYQTEAGAIRRDIITEQGGRKKVITVDHWGAVYFELTGIALDLPGGLEPDWGSAGFTHTPIHLGLNKNEILDACGLPIAVHEGE